MRLRKESLPDLYTSIDDLPQWNWNKVHETGNLNYLEVSKSYRNIKDSNEKYNDLWYDIYNEFINEFGLSDKYTDFKNKRRKITEMKLEYIQTGDKSKLNFINIEEIDINETLDRSQSLGFRETITMIEKYQGVKINVKEITVADFNSYITMINKSAKAS